jgi:hypothetical protein
MKKTRTSTTPTHRPGPLFVYQQGATLVAKRSRPNLAGVSPTDPGTVLQCLEGGSQPTRVRTASEGIYYIIRTPKAWELFTYPYVTGQPQIHHVEFWKAQVAPFLAHAWARAFAQPDYQKSIAARLEARLHDLYYAFPRGRIDRGNGTVFMVRNGNNMKRNMPSKVQIEQAFEINGVCEWEFDSHEQCMDEDAHAIRDTLKLKDSWKSVGPQEG